MTQIIPVRTPEQRRFARVKFEDRQFVLFQTELAENREIDRYIHVIHGNTAAIYWFDDGRIVTVSAQPEQ